MDYRIVSKIICSPEGGYFKGVLTLDTQNNGQGLLKAKINLFLKFYVWSMTPHLDLPS